MTNFPLAWPIEEYKDVSSQNWYKSIQKSRKNDTQALENTKRALQYLARDHARVPMQWDASPNAGFFKTATPWMRVNDDYAQVNVAAQEKSPQSVLAFWKDMIQMRKAHADLFIHAYFDVLEPDSPYAFFYSKTCGSERAIVALNFTKERRSDPVPAAYGSAKLLVSSTSAASQGALEPFEGRVYLVAS